MTNRERLKAFYSADKSAINLRELRELQSLLYNSKPTDVIGLEEHRCFIELLAAYRKMVEMTVDLNGKNFRKTLTSLLSVGEDSMYSDDLRFLFELIQNVDDCEYDDIADAMLRVVFKGNTIQLNYNERGFEPFNVFAITGIAEAAKNIDENKVEIGEKGLGFKSVFGIAESVLIQSGYFSFRLDKNHYTIPVPVYDRYTPIKGTLLTLTLKSPYDVQQISQRIKERYCQSAALFRKNPMLFLNKLSKLELLIDNASKRLLFIAERKEKQALSDRLFVERNVLISATLSSVSDIDKKEDFHESITGDWYTYQTEYTRDMCCSRYGTDTKLTKKKMNLHIIYPHLQYLHGISTIQTGALYSFLPTQITINAPVIICAPFKLDGAREYVDSQGNNLWFNHTLETLLDMWKESVADMSLSMHENLLRYMPKKNNYLFSAPNDKSSALRSTTLNGELLLRGMIFWCSDQQFHFKSEIHTYAGNLPADEQMRIHQALQETTPLFVMPKDLNAADYCIPVIEDPYRKLLSCVIYGTDPVKLEASLTIMQSWIQRVSENALGEKLNSLFPIQTTSTPKLSSHFGTREYSLRLSQIKLIAQYSAFAKAFCKWVQLRLKETNGQYRFAFSDACKTFDITSIDPENPFDLDDVGINARRYLQSIYRKCTLVDGNCICLPMREVLILSKDKSLDLFADFCKVMDKNTRFDITLKFMAYSRELNDAEASHSVAGFMELLRIIRKNGKVALGQSYQSYTNLLHQSGATPDRFINELLQNADDCNYPEGEDPCLVIKSFNNAFDIYYNEVGFTKQNVRAITAIGESTKKRLLSGQPITENTIGEKGIGFKAVFAVADKVVIHSGDFHFGLRASEPTIPVLGLDEKHQDEPGTHMRLFLSKPLSPNLLTKERLLSLCLCLRKIKHITCNNTKIEISDTDGIRKITIDGVSYSFAVHKHLFKVTDTQALQERRQGNRAIEAEQAIYCYIPTFSLRKMEYYLYAGLPTRIKLNIPMVIDAPFELTTSRDDVLENRWNEIIRTQVYHAIYGYTSAHRTDLQIRSLRYIAVKQQSKSYSNNTFEASSFLNAVALSDYARNRVYVPTASGQLQPPNLTKKFPAFLRRIIASQSLFGSGNTLNYSDNEYNPAYFYMGGREADKEDILLVLRKANLKSALNDEVFRKDLYKHLEEQKVYTAGARDLPIIPVWDTVIEVTRFVPFNGKPIYRELEKTQSESPDYWVLNEQQMSPIQYTMIFGSNIETMDHEHAVQVYKKKLLAALHALSSESAYNYLLAQSSINPMLLEAMEHMTADEQRRLVLKNRDGKVVECEQIFILSPNHHVFGQLLPKYVAHSECSALAKRLGRKPLEDIQYADVEDYEGILQSDDLEDLLNSKVPCLRYGRSIATQFYEHGKVNSDAAEEYGLVYSIGNTSLNTDRWAFPGRAVPNTASLYKQMNEQLRTAPQIISREITRSVRGWINPNKGTFSEYDHTAGREVQLANYRSPENRNYCFCQICEKAKRQEYIEVTCIQQQPDLYIPQIYLSLCLECSKLFQGLRTAKKSAYISNLHRRILQAQPNGSGKVTINMGEEYPSITFIDTHLVEMQIALRHLNPSTASLYPDNSTSRQNTQIQNVAKQNPTALSSSNTKAQGTVSTITTSSSSAGILICVEGTTPDAYRLIYYSGKLKKYTSKPHEPKYILLFSTGKTQRIPVCVVPEEDVIYITKENYNKYGKQILQCDRVMLRK